MASLTYNGVTLSYISTQRVRFEPVYDDSGTDYLYTRVSIDVVAVLAQPLAPMTAGENPAETINRVEHLLAQPRRSFVFKVGTKTLVSVGDEANTAIPAIDAKNGPQPTAPAITRIQGDRAFILSYGIVTHIVDCKEGGPGPKWVSHRWSETIDLDEQAMTRRTRSGLIIARSDIVSDVNSLRGVVAPPLEPEFRRISSRYTLDPTGLRLSYEFVDEEQYLQVPDPSAKAEGEYVESTQNGVKRFGEVRLRLSGGKPTDKGVLLAKCLRIAIAKLAVAGAGQVISLTPGGSQVQGNPILAVGYIREDLYKNDVECRFRAILPVLKSRINGVNVNLVRFSRPPLGSEPGTPPFDPGTAGSAQLAHVAAALADPCLRPASLTGNPQTPNAPTQRSGNVPATVTISEVVPDDQAALRVTGEYGIYDHYRVEKKTLSTGAKLLLPLGKRGTGPYTGTAVIQTAAETGMMVVEWEASKVGAPPKIPNPDLKDSNYELFDMTAVPSQVEPGADGVSMRYKVAGMYRYGIRDIARHLLTAALPPWVDPSAASFAAQPLEYADGIILPGQGSFSTSRLEN